MSTEPDFNPEDDQSISRALDKEYLRPPETFKGASLWPLTPGSKALYTMSLDDGDTILYRVLSFLFIHTRRAPDMKADMTANVIPVLWDDINAYRFIVMAQLDGMTEEDIAAATAIWKKEFDLEAASEVIATPPKSLATEKKSEPQARPRSRVKSK